MPYSRSKYPDNWEEISLFIREERAGWTCEGTPFFPDCRAVEGAPHPVTGAKVMLTVAHMDHNTANNDPDNLRALCQRCHNHWDMPNRAKNRCRREITEQIEAGQLRMF